MTLLRTDDDHLPLGPALDFLRTLWRLDHALGRVSRKMRRELGITAEQRLVIRCVGRHPGLSAGRLATLLHLDASTISTTLGRLERRRLVVRRRDPRDHRRVTLELTRSGSAFMRPSAGTVEAAVEHVLRTASARDLAAARRIVDKLCVALEGRARGGA